MTRGGTRPAEKSSTNLRTFDEVRQVKISDRYRYFHYGVHIQIQPAHFQIDPYEQVVIAIVRHGHDLRNQKRNTRVFPPLSVRSRATKTFIETLASISACACPPTTPGSSSYRSCASSTECRIRESWPSFDRVADLLRVSRAVD